jgi:alpha-L-arabinofuranosidase
MPLVVAVSVRSMKPKSAIYCVLALVAAVDLVRAQTATSTAGSPITISLDGEKTGTPISKYIYGQFIEHLGRCIYGGIWAEMLEDRKFFYPVSDKYNPWGTDTDKFWKAGEFKFLNGSPWKVIGPAGMATMDTTAPYVGKHTPVIRVSANQPGGISQEGLEVVKGKKYEGHVVLAGDSSAAPIMVRLVLDDGRALEQKVSRLSSDFQKTKVHFSAPSSSQNARLEIVSQGTGLFRVGTVSLMPADNIKGWRRDTVSLLKELNSPVYRWPGGNFVSGYNWRDGIGERDKRPPRKNPAWKGVEHNDVGIHEFMELMELIKSEPYVSVNTGLGTVEEVAEEVEYCNGPTSTPMGKLRAQNGHAARYGVIWWAVGNEMYGDWQLGHMPLAEYVKKHNRVAEAMWKVDPSIKLVGVGAVGDWTKTMLTSCSDNMNLLSEHIYCQDKPDVVEHSKLLARDIKRVAAAHREYRRTIPEAKQKIVPVAMDEWNHWYGDYVYGELGVRYFLKDGLGVASGLHEYFRNSDVFFMANYAQTVNVIGCIKTTRAAAAFETTGLVLKLYREHFGIIPIEVGQPDNILDLAAAWTADRKAITVGMVNPTPQAKEISLSGGTRFAQDARQWVIGGPDPMSYNEPGKPPAVRIEEKSVRLSGNTLAAPPYSVALYRLQVR